MKKVMPEHCRVTSGDFATTADAGRNGQFIIKIPERLARKNKNAAYNCIVSDAAGWDHVSVTIIDSIFKETLPIIPSWNDMMFIKSIFWEKNEAVFQFHPDENLYTNEHATCLHLWRPYDGAFKMPHPLLVATRGFTLGERGIDEIKKLDEERKAKRTKKVQPDEKKSKK